MSAPSHPVSFFSSLKQPVTYTCVLIPFWSNLEPSPLLLHLVFRSSVVSLVVCV